VRASEQFALCRHRFGGGGGCGRVRPKPTETAVSFHLAPPFLMTSLMIFNNAKNVTQKSAKHQKSN
jgi:hypothetical protein